MSKNPPYVSEDLPALQWGAGICLCLYISQKAGERIMNNYDKAKIDPECLPLVEYFNRHGLTTAMSCQGHNNTNMSMYWIEFASGIGEKDIIRFQQEHMPGILGNFTSNGRFAMRLYMALDDDGCIRPVKGWHYFAATVDAAFEDLEQWKSYDNRRKE